MAGIDAFGTQLQRSDMAGSPTFTAIASVSELSAPELSRDTMEVTAHDSPNQWREFLGSLKDAGEFSATLNYDPGDHDTIIGDINDSDPRNYKMVWPDSIGHWDFAAILTGFKVSAPIDDKLAAEVTFKVTGQPSITTGP